MINKNIVADFVNKRLNNNIDCLKLAFQDALDEFNNEWYQKKFKWFFKRYRQNRLMKEIVGKKTYYIKEITEPSFSQYNVAEVKDALRELKND